MIIQMTGGGFKVFTNDMTSFIGAFSDEELAKMVDERQRRLNPEELDLFHEQKKIIAVPNEPIEPTEIPNLPAEEVITPEVTPSESPETPEVAIKPKRLKKSKKKKA